MDWKEIISMVLQSVLVPLLIYGATLLRNYLKEKAKSDQVRLVLDQAYEAAVFGVSVTAQKFVDEIKGTDKWDQAQMQEAAWRLRLGRRYIGTTYLIT